VSVPGVWPQVLDFFGTPLVIEPSAGQLASDAGLLPVRQFDQRIGLTRAFADALDDPRDPDLTEHSFLEMVRSRVYGILAGYEDQNDHATLRADPVFKLLAERSTEDDDLTSRYTLYRFENAISIQSLKRLREAFLDRFIASGPRRSNSARRPRPRSSRPLSTGREWPGGRRRAGPLNALEGSHGLPPGPGCNAAPMAATMTRARLTMGAGVAAA
jgi:hypothetical protein